MPMHRRLVAPALDLTVIAVFVTLGRRSHDEGGGALEVAETALPFLAGLILGWVAARAWHDPASIRTGVPVWIVTVAAGMTLRRLVFDEGTAPSFVVVATVFLGAGLLGWRWLRAGRKVPDRAPEAATTD